MKSRTSAGYGPSINAGANEELATGRTYVLKTGDGGHATIRFTTLGEWTEFSYRYQSDGSGVFADTTNGTPAVPTSWSQVKLRFAP